MHSFSSQSWQQSLHSHLHILTLRSKALDAISVEHVPVFVMKQNHYFVALYGELNTFIISLVGWLNLCEQMKSSTILNWKDSPPPPKLKACELAHESNDFKAFFLEIVENDGQVTNRKFRSSLKYMNSKQYNTIIFFLVYFRHRDREGAEWTRKFMVDFGK